MSIDRWQKQIENLKKYSYLAGRVGHCFRWVTGLEGIDVYFDILYENRNQRYYKNYYAEQAQKIENFKVLYLAQKWSKYFEMFSMFVGTLSISIPCKNFN